MGPTQITLGEIEIKEGWVKGGRMTDRIPEREEREGWTRMVLKEIARETNIKRGRGSTEMCAY